MVTVHALVVEAHVRQAHFPPQGTGVVGVATGLDLTLEANLGESVVEEHGNAGGDSAYAAVGGRIHIVVEAPCLVGPEEVVVGGDGVAVPCKGGLADCIRSGSVCIVPGNEVDVAVGGLGPVVNVAGNPLGVVAHGLLGDGLAVCTEEVLGGVLKALCVEVSHAGEGGELGHCHSLGRRRIAAHREGDRPLGDIDNLRLDAPCEEGGQAEEDCYVPE